MKMLGTLFPERDQLQPQILEGTDYVFLHVGIPGEGAGIAFRSKESMRAALRSALTELDGADAIACAMTDLAAMQDEAEEREWDAVGRIEMTA